MRDGGAGGVPGADHPENEVQEEWEVIRIHAAKRAAVGGASLAARGFDQHPPQRLGGNIGLSAAQRAVTCASGTASIARV